jgi:DUF2905 family protein
LSPTSSPDSKPAESRPLSGLRSPGSPERRFCADVLRSVFSRMVRDYAGSRPQVRLDNPNPPKLDGRIGDFCQSIDWYSEGESPVVEIDDNRIEVRFQRTQRAPVPDYAAGSRQTKPATNRKRRPSPCHPGWVLRIVGVLIASIGLVWLLTPSIPWLGKLSGDIAIKRENFRFYSPLATCILFSLRIGFTILPVDTEERKAPSFTIKDLTTRRFHS